MIAIDGRKTLPDMGMFPALARNRRKTVRHIMLDIILLAVGVGFLALSVFYTIACDRL